MNGPILHEKQAGQSCTYSQALSDLYSLYIFYCMSKLEASKAWE